MAKTRGFARILAALLVALALHTTAAIAAESDLNAPLPVDPSVRIVTLSNGLECWIRAHKTPPERVGMWMHVGSGSINEEENQRGLAHFLEHMAFEGSENFPPGQLVKYFESIGLTFGHHQNAFTSFDQTTYVLTLPNTDDETVQGGLLCMADFAFRLSLLPDRIETERNVILEEMQSRKGPGQRMFERTLPAILPGSRVAERLPIGKEEVVRSAPPEELRRYYSTWYRPDNTVLLIVGDIEPDNVLRTVKESFADWKPVPVPPEDAPLGIVPYTETRAEVITDPEVTRADVSIIAVRPMEPMLTVGDFRRSLVDSFGMWIVNRRLGEMIRRGTAPFQSASVHKNTLWNVCTYMEAEAAGPPERCLEILRSLAVELKRAREHGFLEQELEDARKAMLAAAEQDARTEGTRDARTFLREMNALASEGRKPISAAQRLELLTALGGGITLEEVAGAFRGSFDPHARLVLATVPEGAPAEAPSKAGLLLAVEDSEAEWVAPPLARERARAILEEEPRPGAVAWQELDPDLLVLSVTLTNGVRAHLRSMDFKKDEVMVKLVLAGGAVWETPGSHGLSSVAALAFQQPATSRLSSTDIRDLLTGKNVNLSGGAGEDFLAIEFGGTPDDIEEGFRLAHALLTDPVIEPSALKVWKESMLQAIERTRTDVRAQLADEANALLTGNDIRFQPLTPSEVAGLTVPDGRRWLGRVIRSSPIELAVVGDIERGRALELVLKYFGSLPVRDAIGPLWEDLREVARKRGPLVATVHVDTVTPTAALLVGWRGADWTAVKDRRVLQIAAQIITTRLREEMREKRGLAYSPYCTARPSKGYRGTGLFASYLAGDPANAEEAAGLIRGVMERFAKEGPTPAEMDTVRKQFATLIETDQKEPRYWLSVLSELDYRGTRLKDVKQVLEKYTTYTREDLVRVVRKHMKEDQRIEVIARPR